MDPGRRISVIFLFCAATPVTHRHGKGYRDLRIAQSASAIGQGARKKKKKKKFPLASRRFGDLGFLREVSEDLEESKDPKRNPESCLAVSGRVHRLAVLILRRNPGVHRFFLVLKLIVIIIHGVPESPQAEREADETLRRTKYQEVNFLIEMHARLAREISLANV